MKTTSDVERRTKEGERLFNSNENKLKMHNDMEEYSLQNKNVFFL